MPRKPYGMICPIPRACDILEPRRTIPILVGLRAGATRRWNRFWDALAKRAQCFIEAEVVLCTGTVSNLMWKMRVMYDADALPRRRVVMQFRFSDPDLEFTTYWVILQPGGPVEICTSIPGLDFDHYVETNGVSLYGMLLGRTTAASELSNGQLYLSVDPVLARTIHRGPKVSAYGQFNGIAMLPGTRLGLTARPALQRVVAG